MDHGEFLAKLGGELAPGDVHGPSTLIAEQSQHVMESMYKKQHVRIRCRLTFHLLQLQTIRSAFATRDACSGTTVEAL